MFNLLLEFLMNTIRSSLLILTALLAIASHAGTQVPFGNEIKTVKNYNRATTQLATSGSLDEGSVQELAQHGFKTIIDLRTEAEGTASEKVAVESAGMTYINIPVTGSGIDTEQLATFVKAFEQAATPVLLHCASVKRAGAMWTAYRLHKGVTTNIAFEEGRTAGMQPSMEEKIRSACQANKTC